MIYQNKQNAMVVHKKERIGYIIIRLSHMVSEADRLKVQADFKKVTP